MTDFDPADALPTEVLPPPDEMPTVVTTVPPLPTLPGYILEERIGRGGFAEVFRGRQTALDRPVAVKVIDPGPDGDPLLLARVRTEATTLARFQHPNIVPVYDYGQDGRRVFIVMELLVGEDLGRRLARCSRLDERAAWLVARQAAAGLAHAAAHEVVHRDIKPANLFLVPPPAGSPLPAGVPLVKVTDFGIARVRWAADGSENPATAAGVALGTPAYMAPEQHGGPGAVDHRADIYALGATVHHALSGAAPFGGATVWEVLARKQTHTLPPLPGVSRETAELVAAMMAADPADRPASYDELLDRIDSLPAVGGAGGRSERTARRRTSGWVGPVGLIACGLAVGGIWAGRPAAPVETPPTAPVETPRRAYVASELPMPLFNRKTLDRWTPESGAWLLTTDDEQATVIEGRGRARVRLTPLSDFLLVFGLDPQAASAAEVRVGRADGPVYAVRVEAGAATFGTRASPTAAFRPLGQPVPVPGDQSGSRPYLEVKVERSGDGWSAWFNGTLAGRATDLGRPDPAAWLVVEGGTARLDTAELTPLVPAATSAPVPGGSGG